MKYNVFFKTVVIIDTRRINGICFLVFLFWWVLIFYLFVELAVLGKDVFVKSGSHSVLLIADRRQLRSFAL